MPHYLKKDSIILHYVPYSQLVKIFKFWRSVLINRHDDHGHCPRKIPWVCMDQYLLLRFTIVHRTVVDRFLILHLLSDQKEIMEKAGNFLTSYIFYPYPDRCFHHPCLWYPGTCSSALQRTTVGCVRYRWRTIL